MPSNKFKDLKPLSLQSIDSIGLKDEEAVSDKKEGKCYISSKMNTTYYCAGFNKTLDLLGNMLGINTTNECNYREMIDEFGERKGLIFLKINHSDGKVIYADEIPRVKQEVERVNNKCLVPKEVKSMVVCEGSKKAFDTFMSKYGLKQSDYLHICKINKKLLGTEEIFETIIGVAKK